MSGRKWHHTGWENQKKKKKLKKHDLSRSHRHWNSDKATSAAKSCSWQIITSTARFTYMSTFFLSFFLDSEIHHSFSWPQDIIIRHSRTVAPVFPLFFFSWLLWRFKSVAQSSSAGFAPPTLSHYVWEGTWWEFSCEIGVLMSQLEPNQSISESLSNVTRVKKGFLNKDNYIMLW